MLPLFICLSLVSFAVDGAEYQCEKSYEASSYKGFKRVPTNCSVNTPSNCPRSWKNGIPEGGATNRPLIHSQFISCHEGFATCGYVPIDPASGEVLGNSGVTVGAGVDLGSKSSNYAPFGSISTSLFNNLEPYFGLTRDFAACAAIERILTLSESEATNLTNVVKEFVAESVAKKYDNDKESKALPFTSLPRGIRTAIASVSFQFGGSQAYPKFWGFVKQNNWKEAVKELRNFYPDPSKQPRGDLIRRNNEADIIEATLVKCNRSIDAVFLLDESGSVSSQSFQESLRFVKQLITAFPDDKLRGNDGTRFGLATFDDSYRSHFHLSQYSSRATYEIVISNIKQQNGLTRLGKALNRILTDQFSESRGLRSEERGIPRVLIVLTDGQSHDSVASPAQRIRDQNIVIHAVGIGGFSATQLREVASSASHVYTLSSFPDLENFIATLTAATCNEPQPVSLGKTIRTTTTKDQFQYYNYNLDSSSNLELTVNDTSGTTMLYLSRSNPHPYKYDNDISFETSKQKEKHIVISPRGPTENIVKRDAGDAEIVPIYLSIVASTDTAQYAMMAKTCDPQLCSEGTNEVINAASKSGESLCVLSFFMIIMNALYF